MALISVQDLSFSYEGSYEPVFSHVSFQIDSAWKLGLVGRNGKGKTTFLRILRGELEYTGTVASGMAFDYFPYEVADPFLTPPELAERYAPDVPGWKFRREAGLLQIRDDALSRPFYSLSNGEQTKVLLCLMFLRQDHFLLIDEPTNHLDLAGREALSAYLSTKSGFILVSHDRSVLDNCVDHILSINRADIEVLRGNCTDWIEYRRRQDAFEMDENERLKKEIGRLKQTAKEKAQWADRSERRKIGFDPTKEEKSVARRAYLAAKSKKAMKRAKAIEGRMERAVSEKEQLLKNIEKSEFLKIPYEPYRKQRLAVLRDLTVCYGGIPVFDPVSFEIGRDQRICIQGINGAGKTSLLRALVGEEVERLGMMELSSGVRISYLSQKTDWLSGSLSQFIERYGLDATLFLTLLRKMDFERSQFEKPMEDYSAGQRKKVLLAKSLSEKANLYIWDEPLNYIDLLSREQIREVLLKFRPTMVFVEHDRSFCEAVATDWIALSINGKQ
jgi:lincosamide and streptogramin A transport system ATP-binding/permease protein